MSITLRAAPVETTVNRQSAIRTLLRRLRIEQGLSQSALAARSGLAASTISRWEAGLSLPGVPELESILRTLQVPPDRIQKAVHLLPARRGISSVQQKSNSSSNSATSSAASHTAEMSAPPVGGDLLRALRCRSGRTQADIAGLVGVPQSVIARWERSESWPNPTRLHLLCYHLGARPEELAALTVGRFSFAQLLDEDDPEALHQEQWRLWAQSVPASEEPLKDLRFLALESRLHFLLSSSGGEGDNGARTEQLQRILSWAYARHSQYLAQVNRLTEAARPAHNALALQKMRWHKRDDEGWIPAFLVLTSPETHRETFPVTTRRDTRTPRRNLTLLQDSLADVHSAAYRGWILSQMALHSLQAGQEDAALRLSAEALHTVEAGEGPSIESERRLRRRDLAGLLAATGRATEAASFLPYLEQAAARGKSYQCIEELLTIAEILFALKDTVGASAALQRAYTLLPLEDRTATANRKEQAALPLYIHVRTRSDRQRTHADALASRFA